MGQHSSRKSRDRMYERTWGIRRPNSNCVEPVCSDGCSGPKETFKSAADVSPSGVDLSPCLPDVVVRELERFLRLYGAVAEKLRVRAGYA